MTDNEMEELISDLHQKVLELEKTCDNFMKTAQAMLSTCRNLEHRLTVMENSSYGENQ